MENACLLALEVVYSSVVSFGSAGCLVSSGLGAAGGDVLLKNVSGGVLEGA